MDRLIRFHGMPEDAAGLPVASLAVAEARLATIAPGFLDQVRQAAGRIAARTLAGSDARASLSAIEDLAVLDLDVPTGSRLPLMPIVKKAVKRLIAWYLSYFGRQVSAFGQAVTEFGGLLLDRTERLEDVTGALQTDVARLTDRVADLERDARGRL